MHFLRSSATCESTWRTGCASSNHQPAPRRASHDAPLLWAEAKASESTMEFREDGWIQNLGIESSWLARENFTVVKFEGLMPRLWKKSVNVFQKNGGVHLEGKTKLHVIFLSFIFYKCVDLQHVENTLCKNCNQNRPRQRRPDKPDTSPPKPQLVPQTEWEALVASQKKMRKKGAQQNY